MVFGLRKASAAGQVTEEPTAVDNATTTNIDAKDEGVVASGIDIDTSLDQLKKFTRVVADTGDFVTLKEFTPQDATTNPSLILKAAQMPAYKNLLEKAIADARKSGASGKALLADIIDRLLVLFGGEILKIVPGRVSTETDANRSFDTQGLLDKAHKFIALYKENGIARERILIKIASTWEGIRAAEVLQKALALRPAYPEALNNLGILYLRTEQRDKAVASFEECIRVAPDFNQAYLNLARVHALENAPENARRILLQLLARHPDDAQAKTALAQLPQ